jgi:hypothetical protein
MKLIPGAIAIAAVVALSALGARTARPAAAANTLNRPADPVVMTGADVPTLTGIAPGLLVAFKYDGGWQQVPVQVDERDVKNFTNIYNDGSHGSGFTTLVYTDAGTFTGADSDSTLDANDEIAFMAADAGDVPPAFSEPAGVVAGSGRQVSVTDPVGGGSGYVYLFRSDGSLDPSAGQQYVTYTFNLLSGPYLTTYNRNSGPNPENSTVASPYYTHHFSDRWVQDQFRIAAGGATNVDILDRNKPRFAPGNCVRTEDTFSNGEGAFIANRQGPVRAIRSYIGANSGPLTQREHIFYAQREDVRTFLRVHAIASIGDFFDYSAAASGMTYRNSANTTGVTVDGAPDSVAAGQITWESVSGAQGSLVMSGLFSTNISGFAYTSYYEDKAVSPTDTCTGDSSSYAFSGPFFNPPGGVPCTDPGLACTAYLNTVRTMYVTPPGLSAAGAQSYDALARAPLQYSVQPWLSTGDSDGDGLPNASDNCPSDANPLQENYDAVVHINPPRAFDDTTNVNSDSAGDACDADDDNDGRSDSDELSGVGCNGKITDPHNPDTDGDLFLDGPECGLGADPTSSASKPALASCGAAGDADGDGVSTQNEVCKYNSNPNSANTDGDGCGDGREVASVNGDQSVTAADLGLVAASFGAYALPAPADKADFDQNKDQNITAGDLGLVAARFGACP